MVSFIVFYEYLDDFVVVYLDDVVVYSQSLEYHICHLNNVFCMLRKRQPYVKLEKCEFA